MFAQHHQKVSLSMDFFFVNGIIFFHTKSHRLNFVSVQSCTSKSLRTIKAGLKVLQNKYKGRSTKIEDYHGDNEFNKASLNDFLQPALLHTYKREEQVSPIERLTRIIKERVISTYNNGPYQIFTILMIRALI